MRIFLPVAFILLLTACGDDEMEEPVPCLGIADGVLQPCPNAGELPVCGGEVMCSYQPDGSIRSRTNQSALCMDELPSCEAVCAILETLPCVNPME